MKLNEAFKLHDDGVQMVMIKYKSCPKLSFSGLPTDGVYSIRWLKTACECYDNLFVSDKQMLNADWKVHEENPPYKFMSENAPEENCRINGIKIFFRRLWKRN